MNVVINIPNDKFSFVEKYLSKEKTKNANEFVYFSAKKDGVSYSLFTTGRLVMQGNNEDTLEKEKKAILNLVYSENKDLILGFDETGRSEISGPFVICGVLGKEKNLATLRDSKKTSNISDAKKEADKGSLAQVSLALNSETVDLLRSNGISLNDMEYAFISNAKKVFDDLGLKFKTIVDGCPLNSKKASWEYLPKADDKINTVSAASVIAKDIRDCSGNKDKRKTWNVKDKD